jgi:hypothetical protein
MEAAKSQEGLVFDGPLHGFATGEVHGLGEGGGEVDIPLFTGLAFNELDLGRETHREALLSLSSHITRYHKTRPITTKKRRNVSI